MALVNDIGEFGRVMRLRRRELGKTQQTIADVVGLNQTTISKVELGIAGVRLRGALLIAQALELNFELVPGHAGAAVERERTTVPAQVVELLRGALYTTLARACEDAPALMPEAHEHSGWMDVLVRIGGARGALDALGWEASAEQEDIAVTLDTAMIEALEDAQEGWDWLSQQEKPESENGRAQALVKAEMIERFLASVTKRSSSATPTDGEA